jgi:hypothetical protein
VIVFIEESLFHCGAKFEDAGACGFYGDGERESGGFVEEENDAIEFAFAGTAGEGEADGMKEITAADVEFVFELVDEGFEAVGIQLAGFEKMQGQMTDDVSRGVAGQDGVGIWKLHDLGGVEFEDETEDLVESRAAGGVMTEKRGGVIRPGELLGGWLRFEPMIFF